MFLGFLASVFAVNVPHLIFSVGIVTGSGAGCCYLPSVSMVAMYFNKKRSVAMGLSASGLGVGAFLMPLYLNWMVETYGWRGCILILAGLSLHMSLLGLLMWPLETAPKCRNCKPIEESEVYGIDDNGHAPLAMYSMCEVESVDESDDDYTECNTGCGTTEESGHFLSSCRRPTQDQISTFEDRGVESSAVHYFPSPILIPVSVGHSGTGSAEAEFGALIQSLKESNNVVELMKKNSKSTIPRLYAVKHDSRIGGSLQYIRSSPLPVKSSGMSLSLLSLSPSKKLPRHSPVESLSGLQIMMAGSLYNALHSSRVVKSMVSLQSRPDSGMLPDSNKIRDCKCKGKSDKERVAGSWTNDEVAVLEPGRGSHTEKRRGICNKVSASLGVYLRLMKHGTFMLFCLSNFLTNLSFFMPVLYMVDRAMDEGLDKTEAAMLVSLYGVGNIFGKLFFGWLADRSLVDRLFIYVGCLTVCGASTSLSPLCGASQTLHSIYSFSFGCFIGSYCTLFPVVTLDLVGTEVVDESFGILLCFMGVATAFGSPLAGENQQDGRNHCLSLETTETFHKRRTRNVSR